MAITKIGSIKTTLSLAINYILNPQKTDNGKYVYSFGCTPNGGIAEKEFLDIRSLGTGKGNVLAQHIKQSFKYGEITPEQALQIGIETMEKFLDNRYQYIVTTHIDKKHIHNHIIFNNVDFVSYRTFEYQKNRGKNSWKILQNINDEICKKHNLSVIENPQHKGKCYYEWQVDLLGKSWKSKLRNIIDQTIMESANFEEFLQNIKNKNVDCVYTPEKVIKIKFRMDGQERFSRGRTLGWYYDEPQIRKRIEQYNLLKNGISGRTYKTKIINTNELTFQTSKGLLHWAEIQNMKEASRLINILTNNNLTSQNELEEKATDKYNDRMVIVSKLNSKQNRVNELTDVIKFIRTYKKYKGIHNKFLAAKNKNQFKKENITELKKFDDAAQNLLKIFPDKKLPNINTLMEEKNRLTQEVKEMNTQYKLIVDELKDIEFARETAEKFV